MSAVIFVACGGANVNVTALEESVRDAMARSTGVDINITCEEGSENRTFNCGDAGYKFEVVVDTDGCWRGNADTFKGCLDS